MTEYAVDMTIAVGLIAVTILATVLVGLRAVKVMRPTLFPYNRFIVSTVVEDGTVGVLSTRGRFDRIIAPGAIRVGPRQRLQIVAIGERTVEITSQELLTMDRFTIRLAATLIFHVSDPRAYLVAAQNIDRSNTIRSAATEAVERDTRLGLRTIAAARTLDALLSDRSALDADLLGLLVPAAASYGITVDRAVLRDIILPPEVRRAFTEVERVRLEALATLERARGEQAALRSLANAARLLKNSPELMNLRILQTVEGMDARKRVTLVLGEGLMSPIGSGPSADEQD